MYALAEINAGGYIYVQTATGRFMVHKDTREMHKKATCFDSLRAVRACWAEPSLDNWDATPIALRIDDEGGAERVYAPKETLEKVRERLQVWKGCYGAWPLTLLKEANP